jgi:glycosyltransferase involved in cell wall biosynthesis
LNAGKCEVLVNAKFLTQTLTGVQRYSLELVKTLYRLLDRGELNSERYSLLLLAPSGTKGHDLDLKRIPLKQVGRLTGTLWSQLELPRHARSGVLWSPANAGPIYHARHVVTIHDASVLDHPEWFSARFAAWYRFLLPRLAKNAVRILTVSEFSRKRLVETLAMDPERVSVVPNGVDTRFATVPSDAAEAVQKRLGLPRDYVLALGSLEPRKNIGRLLNAWALLLLRKEIDEDVHLVIAGGKSSLFRDAGLPAMPDRVVLTGYVTDEDLPALYSRAIAFVYPSLYEGFGLPPLEAMACGVPVVASGSTSVPEVTDNAALLVDPHETEAIAEGLRSVLGDADLRASLRAAGLERVKVFSWDNSARLVWNHLAEVADN